MTSRPPQVAVHLRFFLLSTLLVAAPFVAAAEPSKAAPGRAGETEDPFNRIHSVVLTNGKPSRYSMKELSKGAVSSAPFERDKKEEVPPEPKRSKIHPMLSRWLESRGPEEAERLIVSFRDDFVIPRFPEPGPAGSGTSKPARAGLERAEALVRELEGKRAAEYRKLGEELRRYKAEVAETFWLVKAIVVKMPLGSVKELAEREDVLYVEPQVTGEPPPQNANPNDDVDDGRARMVTDPYFNLGLTGGFIGLLDTGLRFSHQQYNTPSHVAFRFDCVNGGASCNSGGSLNPNDDCWNHGTSSGAIITANARQGGAFRGVTGVTLDSLKVYPSTFNATGGCTGGLDQASAIRGFQRAVAILDRVIVAEMQGSGDDLSAISTAANNAFDAGAVVIAANGNNGPNASTVNTPANAHRVLGVGNFDVQTQAQIASESRGPAPDNRIKPDIQAPTNTETASNASDTAFQVFSGTSGATPYAAGAAALLRNFLRGTSFSFDPGQVYAVMILSGQQPFPFNNTSGAGPLRLPTDGVLFFGKVAVRDGDTIDIPIGISGGAPNTLDGALWWPESAFRIFGFRFGVHNDIDLHLVDPGGATRASSISIPSVFERARVSGTVASGTWKVRIRGFRVPGGPQTVFWAAHVRLH